MTEQDNVIDATVTENTGRDWRNELKNAPAAKEKQQVVTEYFKEWCAKNNVDFNKIQPLIPSLTQAADEVGLSEEELPLITFLKIYYEGNRRPALSADQYIKLHNAYSTGEVDENNLTDTSASHIIFNPTLYQENNEDDFRNMVEVYNILSSPENAKKRLSLNPNEEIKIAGKNILGSKILENPTVLRDYLLLSGNKVRKWADVLPVWKKISKERAAEDYKEALKALYALIKKEKPDIYKQKDFKYKLLLAIENLYQGLNQDYKNKIDKLLAKNIKKTKADYIKENQGDIDSLINTLRKAEQFLNKNNVNYIVSLILENTNLSTDDEEDKEKNQNNNNNKVVHKKSNEKYEAMKEYIDKLVDMTNSNKETLYRYLTYVLASYKPKSGESLMNPTNSKDKEFYDLYIKNNLPQALGSKFSQARLDDLMSRPAFTKGLTKNIAKQLIKYIEKYKPAKR